MPDAKTKHNRLTQRTIEATLAHLSSPLETSVDGVDESDGLRSVAGRFSGCRTRDLSPVLAIPASRPGRKEATTSHMADSLDSSRAKRACEY